MLCCDVFPLCHPVKVILCLLSASLTLTTESWWASPVNPATDTSSSWTTWTPLRRLKRSWWPLYAKLLLPVSNKKFCVHQIRHLMSVSLGTAQSLSVQFGVACSVFLCEAYLKEDVFLIKHNFFYPSACPSVPMSGSTTPGKRSAMLVFCSSQCAVDLQVLKSLKIIKSSSLKS